MKHQEQIHFQAKNYSLAQATQAKNPLALGFGDRRLNGAQEKRAGQPETV
jgi:hypothetical protein